MAQRREIRDPIHGFIERSRKEEKVIDTKVFQRLRGIRQLAMANLVYPGALHTRFDHSIGVMHLSERQARQLRVRGQRLLLLERKGITEEIRIIRLAALLHDLGHGPFSHVSEKILRRYYKLDKEKPKTEKIHEFITCDIIEKNAEFSDIISNEDCKSIVNILKGNIEEPVVQSIISGPLDADKLDYLLRDSHFCGVKYGVYDIDRLIGTLIADVDPFDTEISKTKKLKLAATRDGVYAIEQFVLAKYHMTAQVYHHKIRQITDAMIMRGIVCGIEIDKMGDLEKLFTYDGTDGFVNNYIQWDDSLLMNEILKRENESNLSAKIFRRLKERKLHKKVFSIDINKREFADGLVSSFLSGLENESELASQIEKEIAGYLSIKIGNSFEPYEIIVNKIEFESVKESVSQEGEIVIVDGKSKKRFSEASPLFDSLIDKQSQGSIEIYAPLERRNYWKLKNTETEFKEIIAQVTNNYINTVNNGGNHVT